MLNFQRDFIELAIAQEALRFGRFTLKSGRESPYFFNAGLFNTGSALAQLGRFYADALTHANLDYDMLLGPAYKGIPLVATTAVALADHKQRDVPYAFNRKEAKNHGEGGSMVGSPLAGKVVVVDDVITAGTAIREVIQLIYDNGAEPAGVIVGLNRQEKGQGPLSAMQELERDFSIPVISIAALEHIITYLEGRQVLDGSENKERQGAIDQDLLARVRAYRQEYGV